MKWWQWILIIITAGAVFYLIYPKYYFGADGVFRCNRITGKVERTCEYSSDLPLRIIK